MRKRAKWVGQQVALFWGKARRVVATKVRLVCVRVSVRVSVHTLQFEDMTLCRCCRRKAGGAVACGARPARSLTERPGLQLLMLEGRL